MQGLEAIPPEERDDPLMRLFENGTGAIVREMVNLGDSWLFLSITDKTEPYHRVDVIDGVCYCTCRGARKARNGCKHVNRVLEEIE